MQIRIQKVVAVVVLVCSSICRCDFTNHPELQELMSTMMPEQANSLKKVLGLTAYLPSTDSIPDLPLGSATNILDIPPAQQANANNRVNEVESNIASQQAAEQSAAAQSQQVAEQVIAAQSQQAAQQAAANAAAQSQAEQIAASEADSAAQAAQTAISPEVTGCGLSLPDGMIPELPLPILSHLLPSLSALPPHILAQLPMSILSQLPPDVLEKLPTSILSDLPVDALSKLSLSTLSDLPANALAKLPLSVVSQLPAGALEKLPTDFLAGLPLSVLSGLPQPLLSRIVQDILGQLPLPLPMLYQLTSFKQLATPDAISNLLGVIDIFKTISGLNAV